jgi:hypothetical protein
MSYKSGLNISGKISLVTWPLRNKRKFLKKKKKLENQIFGGGYYNHRKSSEISNEILGYTICQKQKLKTLFAEYKLYL